MGYAGNQSPVKTQVPERARERPDPSASGSRRRPRPSSPRWLTKSRSIEIS